MDKAKMLKIIRLSLLQIFISIIFLTSSSIAQPNGEQLFQNNCSSCHKLGTKLIGPDLLGVNDLRPHDWLLSWVKNSQEVVKSGDEYAENLFKEYNGVVMPPMPLNDDEINAILGYIKDQTAAQQAKTVASSGGQAQEGSSSTAITQEQSFMGLDYDSALAVLIILAGVLLFFTILLLVIQGQLKKLEWKKEHPEEKYEPSGISKALKNIFTPVANFFFKQFNPTIGVLTLIGIFVLFLSFNLYHRAQDLGTQIGYAPEQPIKFSHKLHAGTYQIDCQYCHTGVTKSKSANLPSLNICMNCHDYVKEGPKYGKKEIAKLIDAYENHKPVKWVRIHNLPDLVYFNHSQHVKVGKIKCQTCHGEVQDMTVVQQHAKLEMGWCINCHRNTPIDNENGYYKAYYPFMKSHENYTVSEMGGTDCQRCHY